MQDPRKQKKGFDPAAFQAAAKAGQQQAYLQQNLDPDTKAPILDAEGLSLIHISEPTRPY